MSREKLLKNPNHAPIVETYEKYINNIGKEKMVEINNNYDRALKSYFDSVKASFQMQFDQSNPWITITNDHTRLYNTMQKRIIPFSARGNGIRAKPMHLVRNNIELFSALIEEWRSDFKNQKLPFFFVQLANYDHPSYGIQHVGIELE